MDKNYEIVEFKNGEFKLDVSVTPNSDTVWLNVNQRVNYSTKTNQQS